MPLNILKQGQSSVRGYPRSRPCQEPEQRVAQPGRCCRWRHVCLDEGSPRWVKPEGPELTGVDVRGLLVCGRAGVVVVGTVHEHGWGGGNCLHIGIWKRSGKSTVCRILNPRFELVGIDTTVNPGGTGLCRVTLELRIR